MNPIQQAIEACEWVQLVFTDDTMAQERDPELWMPKMGEALTSLRSLQKEVEGAELPPLNPARSVSLEAMRYVVSWPKSYIEEWGRTAVAAALGRGAVAQEDEGRVVVTWNHDRTRILAVTRQNAEGQILKVIAEAPAQPTQAEVPSEREAFEAYMRSIKPMYRPSDDSLHTRREWATWQAALQWQAEQQKGEARWWIVEWRSNTTGGVLRTTRPMRTEHEALAAKADLERGYISEHFTYVVTPLFASPHGVPPKPTRENGPFKARQSPSGKTFICSDDFHHDVTLTVQGDFGYDALKLRYAEYLAAILTAGISSLPQAPQGEQWTCPKCGVERDGPLIACKQDGCPTAPTAQAVTVEELRLFEETMEQFEDCGETDTPYETLMKWAARGWLECQHFVTTAEGNRVLAALEPPLFDAAPTAQGDSQ